VTLHNGAMPLSPSGAVLIGPSGAVRCDCCDAWATVWRIRPGTGVLFAYDTKDPARQIIPAADAGCWVLYSRSSAVNSGRIVRLDGGGELAWGVGSDSDIPVAMAAAPGGRLYVASLAGDQQSGTLRLLDTDGSIVWAVAGRYGRLAATDFGVVLSAAGWLVAYDAAGSQVWSVASGFPQGASSLRVAGGYVYAGGRFSNAIVGKGVQKRAASDGALVWTYGPTAYTFDRIDVDATGRVLSGGVLLAADGSRVIYNHSRNNNGGEGGCNPNGRIYAVGDVLDGSDNRIVIGRYDGNVLDFLPSGECLIDAVARLGATPVAYARELPWLWSYDTGAAVLTGRFADAGAEVYVAGERSRTWSWSA